MKHRFEKNKHLKIGLEMFFLITCIVIFSVGCIENGTSGYFDMSEIIIGPENDGNSFLVIDNVFQNDTLNEINNSKFYLNVSIAELNKYEQYEMIPIGNHSNTIALYLEDIHYPKDLSINPLEYEKTYTIIIDFVINSNDENIRGITVFPENQIITYITAYDEQFDRIEVSGERYIFSEGKHLIQLNEWFDFLISRYGEHG